MLALALSIAGVAAAQTPSPPTPPGAHSGGVRVVSQSARWTGLLPMNELKDDTDSMFLISGELENDTKAPVTSVKIGYELLSDTSNGEVLLASEYGYNFRAERCAAQWRPATSRRRWCPCSRWLPARRTCFAWSSSAATIPRFRSLARAHSGSALVEPGIARNSRDLHGFRGMDRMPLI
jgi:hypothetical protein